MLSLAVSPCKDHYITSSADAKIAKHPLPCNRSIFKTAFKPIKISNSKHAGQQGLSYRSDGRIFATAGWDSALRVYSAKTLKEVAVLKWHKEGCYSTAFASVNAQTDQSVDPEYANDEGSDSVSSSQSDTLATIRTSVQQRRDQAARSTHWLAAGSKDGKISLWDIFQ